MPPINVEPVEFTEPRNGAVYRGVAVFATTISREHGVSLDYIAVRCISNGGPELFGLAACALTRDSYVRVCRAIGIEPWENVNGLLKALSNPSPNAASSVPHWAG
jgi:hypothetical protein